LHLAKIVKFWLDDGSFMIEVNIVLKIIQLPSSNIEQKTLLLQNGYK